MKWVWFISFFFSTCEALLLDSQFRENLTLRYGNEVMAYFESNPENKIEAKQLLNSIEKQETEQIEILVLEKLQTFPALPQAIFKRFQELKNSEVRCKFALELLKCLTLSRDIPSLGKSCYLEEQFELLKKMLIVLEQDEKSTFGDYLNDTHNPSIRYFFEGGKKSALFKPSTHERDAEIAFWEISLMLGLERVSVPAASVSIQEHLGVFQSYVSNVVVGAKAFNKGVSAWILRDSYLHTSLAVLLFSMRDIHQSNMAYSSSSKGYFAIRLFDTTHAFSSETFDGFLKGGHKVIDAPFAWSGWDDPQASLPLSKEEKRQLALLAKKWSIEDLVAYVKHPMTNVIFTEEELSAFLRRVKLIKKHLLSKQTMTPLDWLNLLAPYSIVRKKINHYFPSKGASEVLFQLLWNPELVRSWLPHEKRNSFEQWLESF